MEKVALLDDDEVYTVTTLILRYSNGTIFDDIKSMESSGPPPQGDVNLGPGIVAVIVVLLTLSIIVVGLRFATRIWIVKKLGWDDWTILFALVRRQRKE